MKHTSFNRKSQFLIALLVTAVVLITLALQTQKKTHVFMTGAAVENITPETGSFIAGHTKNRRFTGIHDSLYVKAIVWTDTKNSTTLLTFDCIGLLYPALLEIRKEVAKRIPSPQYNPENIVISSTHTHSGTDVVGIWGANELSSGVDSAYMKKLVLAAADAVEKAWKKKQPSTVHYAENNFGNDWVYNISDSTVLDRALTVLQFKDAQGNSIATLTNFACHPTIMDGANNQVSADYVGGMYQYLDKIYGGTNFFLQGSIGGWVQPEYEPKNFETAGKRGLQLGMAVENALKKQQKIDAPAVTFKSNSLKLPVSNKGFKLLAAAGVIKRSITDSVTTEMAWFTLGTAQFITHPGESTPVHSLQSKQYLKTKGPKFVLGLSQDALGYILTPDFFEPDSRLKHKEYLTSMSIDKEAGNLIIKAVAEITQ